MAQFKWGLLCRRVIVDLESNLISYIDAVEAFGSQTFPFPCPPIFVGTAWERDGKEAGIELRAIVYSPNGQQINVTEASPLVFGEHHLRGRVNLLLYGFAVPEPGTYKISLEHKVGSEWQRVHILSMNIGQLPREAA